TTSTALEKAQADISERDDKLGETLRIAAQRKASVGELTKELVQLRKSFVQTTNQKDTLAEKFSKMATQSKLRTSALTAAGTKVERELTQARREVTQLTTQVQTATEQRDALSKSTQKDMAIMRQQLADLTTKVDRAASEIEQVGADAALPETAPAVVVKKPADSNLQPANPVKKDLATSLAERIRSLQEHQKQRA
ncbi:MAG: hypothetical protein ACTSUY_07070, partial [Alphaproteobacteria bacterium]